MIERTLVCIVLCGFMTAGSLLAHHSLAGVYDMKKDMELSGAVESVKFVNPHGSLTIAVKNPDGSSHQLSADTWLGHGSCAARDRHNRTERPARR